MSYPISQPLRPLTDAERSELIRVSHAKSERQNRYQRAVALLAVEAGKNLTDAAKAAGWKAQKTVTRLLRRFHERGLAALDDLPRSGHPRTYGWTERTNFPRTSPPSLAQRRRHRDVVTCDATVCLARSLRWLAAGEHIYHSLHAARGWLQLAKESDLV